MLDIKKEKNGNLLKISLDGRLDTTTAPKLEEEVSSSLDGVSELVFDLSKLEYISSAGLRVLLSSHKRMIKLGGMKVTGISDEINDIFEITGFSDILTIEK